MTIDQEEYCFDVCLDENGASLLMNSKEQMFTEKLRSLLKFGTFSRRYKDIFDMCYLIDKLDVNKLQYCLKKYIYDDEGMKENNIDDIIKRLSLTLKNKFFQNRVKTSRRNCLNKDVEILTNEIIDFFKMLKKEVSVNV